MAQIPRSRLVVQIDELQEQIKLLREELAYEKRNKIKINKKQKQLKAKLNDE